jgi:hypothetical protein
MIRRERKWQRRQTAEAKRPAYYLAPYRSESRAIDRAAWWAWRQADHWITAAEWLAWLRRSGPRTSYVVYGRLTRGKWVPMPRPCISAHWNPSSTRRRGGLPDSARYQRNAFV